jgi:hypothetical protein
MAKATWSLVGSYTDKLSAMREARSYEGRKSVRVKHEKSIMNPQYMVYNVYVKG